MKTIKAVVCPKVVRVVDGKVQVIYLMDPKKKYAAYLANPVNF